ncbi:hypothetical protein [Nocardia mexicana]|uniref:DUF8176 domain-containing protein n=1 Tax=Nocardia mexicana TaxID=279262 RepID=A0A370H570_9NOCA|nr:hypothetical protein [Nocardia mexicana]RDI51547.1 hypothetical protein DFR68_10430 [Nocardia mexicana]
MASEDDANYDETGRPGPRDRGESEFGPPVSEFGPPLSEFGPPLTDFGPPTGDSGSVGWAPVDEPDRPNLGWQPADAPATPPAPPVPPPPPQYRAPDSGSAPPSRGPAPTGQRDPYRGPEGQRGPGPDMQRGPEAQRPPGPDMHRGSAQESRRPSDSGRSAPPSPPSQPSVRYPEESDQGSARRPATPPRESSGSLWDDDELAKKLVAARPSPRESSSSSSLWDDDDLAKKLAPSRPVAEPEPEKPRRNTGVLIGGLAAAFVVIVAIAAVIVFATRNNGGGTEETSAAPPPTSAVGSVSCPARTDGRVTIGNGPGGTDSGVGAILGFQHAFYADRSAANARAFVAPGAVDVAQEAIDTQVPRGTSYCLRIEEVAPNVYNVDVNEYRQDGGAPQYLQQVTVENRDGKYLIAAVVPR